jgi:hypothetical protein
VGKNLICLDIENGFEDPSCNYEWIKLCSMGVNNCHYTKTMISDPTNNQTIFFYDGKKDEAIEVIMTYISWEIYFHIC